MGQRTPRCPAAVSLFAFLGELYVNVNLGPAYPRLLGTVRRRFACVFLFFYFYYLLLLFTRFLFSRRDVEQGMSPVVLVSPVAVCFDNSRF